MIDQAALLDWFEQRGRDLPWRDTRDPWAVLVSELMLQQTQVARVIPKYLTFLERFPTAISCAAASVGDVVKLWQGLGYNRRAVNLHRCAGEVVARFDGQFPRALDDLLSLPGVGPYTARAVMAFAFEDDAGVLDTNVARILARQRGGSLAPTEAQDLADGLVPSGRAWAWNQAMLDLGATVCEKRSPACSRCPCSATCVWFGTGLSAPDPAVGSAGVSGGQSTFEGSDRQGRGRLVDALRAGPVRLHDLPAVMGWPTDVVRAETVAAGVVADGLAQQVGATLRLPS